MRTAAGRIALIVAFALAGAAAAAGPVAGEVRFAVDGVRYRIAGADLGVLQLAPGWSSVTGVARAADRAPVAALVVLDRPAGGGKARLRIALAGGKDLTAAVD
jgi:hypothetical protein